MNRLMFFATFALSSSALLLLDSTVKGSFVLLLAVGVVVLLRRDSAAARHLVWLVAVVALLVIPGFSALLPSWRVLPSWAKLAADPVSKQIVSIHERGEGVRAMGGFQAATISTNRTIKDQDLPTRFPDVQSHAQAPFDANAGASPVAHADVLPVRSEEQLQASSNIVLNDLAGDARESELNTSLFVSRGVAWVWGIGVCFLALRLVAARLLLWSCESGGKLLAKSYGGAVKTNENCDEEDKKLVGVFEDAVKRMRVRATVRLLLHAERSVPLVWGLWRVRLQLPEAAKKWGAEQVRSVLMHELAHIKRRDTLAQLLAQVACAIYWFHPLVWFAAWRLHVERERACDDLVLSNGVPASTYAEHLLNVTTRLASSPWNQACGLAMARKSSLEGRLLAVLNEKHNRRHLTSLVVVTSLLVGGATAIPLSMLSAANADLPIEDTNPLSENEDAGEALVPKNAKAKLLLERWQIIEERNDWLRNSTVQRVRHAIDSWIKQPPAKVRANDVKALQDWEAGREEHPVDAVARWLDRIAEIDEGPIQFAINGERNVSRPLTEAESKSLRFGPTSENGLRVAWGRSPVKETYQVGDVIETSLLIQNTTEEIIEFQCPYSLADIIRWDVKDAKNQEINVKQVELRGSVALVTFHVKPQQVAEIKSYSGLTIGESAGDPLLQLNAKAGQRVTVRWSVRKPVVMGTGNVSFTITEPSETPIADASTGEPTPVDLSDETERTLKWGEPVNGLRLALSRLSTLGGKKVGYSDFDLVIQNVSDAAIRLVANDQFPDDRMLRIRKDGVTMLGLRSGQNSDFDLILNPGKAIIWPVFVAEESAQFDEGGKSYADEPDLTFYAVFKIEQAPKGAWTGKILSPTASGATISGKKAPTSKNLSTAYEQKLQWGETVNGLPRCGHDTRAFWWRTRSSICCAKRFRAEYPIGRFCPRKRAHIL